MPRRTPRSLSRARALEIARHVHSGAARSYVSAAIFLAEYLLQEEALHPSPPAPALPIDALARELGTQAPPAPYEEPDPFPDSPPHARRFLAPAPSESRLALTAQRLPGEHALGLPASSPYSSTAYRTNRPPEPEDLRAMRSPPSEELVPAPRTRISDRPDPYDPAADSSRKPTRPSMRSPIPHPVDSSSTLVYDFSPANTPPLPPATEPEMPTYCGLCDHEFCTCPPEAP